MLKRVLIVPELKRNLISESFNVDADIIHCRLGHAGANVLRKHNLSISGKNCEACIYGEHRVKSVSHKASNRIIATTILELIHMDLIGPLEVKSHGGAKYILSIVDDYSRYSFVYFF